MDPEARDRRHEEYDYWRYEGRDWRWFEHILVRMRAVPPVLDVGAGLGLFTECCAKHHIRAIALELSRQGTAAIASRRLAVVRGDLWQPFPFRDDAFGSALAHHVLEHVPAEREDRVLREIRRVLRPGGFLFVVSPNPYNPGARDDVDHVNLFTAHELFRKLRGAGFRKVSLGTNYWRPVWESLFRLGRIGPFVSGALWKIAPIDRFAGTSSAMAWK